MLGIFLTLSVALQSMKVLLLKVVVSVFPENSVKVYLDFLLGNWVEGGDESAENIREFYKIFCCLSLTIIVLTYFYNILGQWIGSCLRLPTGIYISSTQRKITFQQTSN